MNCIIIEDEKPAARKLVNALSKCNQQVNVLATITTVDESVKWLQSNPQPELIFMDIELTDGTAFNIFERLELASPVIFTTAYDEYWQEAFEQHSIDYLLKPIKQEKLDAALKKYEKLKQFFASRLLQLNEWRQQQSKPSEHKKRFLVKRGTDYISIKTEDISYFYATHKLVCLVDQKGQKFILDESLSDIEKQVDPAQFYRVNRKYLVHSNAIQKIKSYPKSKLQLELQPGIAEDIIISQENVSAFKEWMGK